MSEVPNLFQPTFGFCWITDSIPSTLDLNRKGFAEISRAPAVILIPLLVSLTLIASTLAETMRVRK